MRLFWELTWLSAQRQITYRAATLAGLVTNFFFGILRASVIVALYGQQQSVAGISLQGAITYTGISQASIAFLSLFGWFDLMNSVYTGQVGADLLKPMSYLIFWMAQDLGRALVNLILRGFTIMVFYALFYKIATPQSWEQVLALVFALFLAWLVSFSFRFLINLISFWTPNALGILRLFFAMSWFFSGFFMPLDFFPDWFVHICYLTPFPHMIYTIVQVYLGLLSRAEMLQALFTQLFWIIILVILGQVVLRMGLRRLVIVGG
jgi:ABC-2 type transport system permease protein